MLNDFFESHTEAYYTPEQTKLIAKYLIDLMNDPLKASCAMFDNLDDNMNDNLYDSGKEKALTGAALILLAMGGTDEENRNIPASKNEAAKKSIMNYLNKHNRPLYISTDYNTPPVIYDMLAEADIKIKFCMTPCKSRIEITNKDVCYSSGSTEQSFTMAELDRMYASSGEENAHSNKVEKISSAPTRAYPYRSSGKER